jgi:hypothetical protein
VTALDCVMVSRFPGFVLPDSTMKRERGAVTPFIDAKARKGDRRRTAAGVLAGTGLTAATVTKSPTTSSWAVKSAMTLIAKGAAR